MQQLPVPSLVDRAPADDGRRDRGIARAAAPVRRRDARELPAGSRLSRRRPRRSQQGARVRRGAGRRAARGLFSRRKAPETKPGLYLDGGFGVGKTHLLAALWKLAPGRKYFGTFIEYTALVGALGYAQTVQAAEGREPSGDRRVRARRPGRHHDHDAGCSASSSRRAPGSPRPRTRRRTRSARAASRPSDFLREIQALVRPLRDRADRRTRLPPPRRSRGTRSPLDDAEFDAAIARRIARRRRPLDDFDAVLQHLATRAPVALRASSSTGLDAVGLRGVHVLTDQTDALRFVAFVDRLYDEQVRVVATGVPLDQVFGDEMLAGGYRKKYLRAVSRLIALTN